MNWASTLKCVVCVYVMLLGVQVLNLVVWACLLVRTRGGSL